MNILTNFKNELKVQVNTYDRLNPDMDSAEAQYLQSLVVLIDRQQSNIELKQQMLAQVDNISYHFVDIFIWVDNVN